MRCGDAGVAVLLSMSTPCISMHPCQRCFIALAAALLASLSSYATLRRSRRLHRVAIYIEAWPGVAWLRRGCCWLCFSSLRVAFHRFAAVVAASIGVVVTFSSLR